MKIDVKRSDVQVSGMVGQRTFSVDAGAHIMAVLSGLYQNPVDAMVREYLTNMYDAYVALKRMNPSAKIIPPELHIPTAMDTNLTFTDYGVGMTLDQVWNVYAVYGRSSKNDSNEEVGGFGLGSKTAFCYNGGQSWAIESRRDGVKNVFAAFIGEDGVPNLTHVSSEKSDEHSGMTIQIPINRTDYRAVKEAVLKYAPHFPMELTITGDTVELKPRNYVLSSTKWAFHIRPSYGYDRSATVIMGNVPYTVHADRFQLEGNSENTENINMFLRQNKIDLFMDIGAVDIVPSRDGLKYTPRTMNALHKAIREMIADLPAVIGKEIDSCITEWEAVSKLREVDKIGVLEIMPKITWKGKKISTKYISRTLDSLKSLDANATVTQYGIVDSDTSKIDVIESPTTLNVSTRDNTFVVINDLPRGGALTTRALVYNKLVNKNGRNGRAARYGHTVGHALLIQSTLTKADLSTFFGGMPADRIKLVSDLKGTMPVPMSLKATKDTIYRWSGSSWQARVNIPDGKATYYYLPLEKDGARYNYVTKGYRSQKDTIATIIEVGNSFGMDMSIIYGMKKDDTPNLSSNWINVEEAVTAEVTKQVHANVRLLALSRVSIPHDIRSMVDLICAMKLESADPVVAQLVEDVKLVQNASTSNIVEKLRAAGNLGFGVNPDAVKEITKESVPDFKSLLTNIYDKYPMFEVINSVYQNRYDLVKVLPKYHKSMLDYLKSV